MNTEEASHLALERRRLLQEEARGIGVSEEYISLLVDEFYKKVRAHPELGPVFNDVIRDGWPEHLDRMKLFWNSIALRTGTYSGNPLQSHQSMTNAMPEHFVIWLDLFEQTLRETANAKVAEYFMGFATMMGERMSKAMFS